MNNNNGGAGAANNEDAANSIMRPASKKTSKSKTLKNKNGNPILGKLADPKTITLGKSSKQKAKNSRKAKKNLLIAEARNSDPKLQIQKRLSKYRSEADKIYEKDESSIEKAKKLLSLIDKLYYRMPTQELKDIVEVAIDSNTLAESILDVYKNILEELGNKVEEAYNNGGAAGGAGGAGGKLEDNNVKALANLFKGFGV